MKKLLLFLFFIANTIFAEAQFSLSDNHHFILKNQKPFVWIGDTAWELFHRLNREEADQYLKKRAEQGFTLIQAVVLAEFDGLHTPNPYGNTPLKNDDPTQPNESYFEHVDYIIQKAEEYGLTIGLLPTWGDKIWKSSWGTGPEIFNEVNAKIYGKWIGQRYKNKQHIIWILGGDRNPQNNQHIAIWRAMASGIEDGVGGSDKAFITFHPQPNQKGASEWFHDDKWLDFNMFQNGHCRDQAIYNKIYQAYLYQPIKPVLDAEPIYEDHPVCFNANDLGVSSAYDVRKYAYLDVFAGAFGHTYGCHDIWQFYAPNQEAVNNPHIYWQEALLLPGANQMKFLRKLIESYPITERIPDQSLIIENDLAASERIQATRGSSYAWIYTAAGKAFTLVLGKISGKQLKAFWYDPKTGISKPSFVIENQGQQKMSPPSTGYGNDWVLVLEDTSNQK
jgi:hypothetical protein